jgi:ABC-type phosphate transport system substrate-binding protein
MRDRKLLFEFLWDAIRIKMSNVPLLVFCMLMTGLSFNVFANDIYIITLNDQFSKLSENRAKMIYRGKSTTLSGNKIVLLDLAAGSSTRDTFYSKLLRKNATQMNVQWASQAFSGKSNTPEELSNNDFSLVLSWLEENPNGLAYFSFSTQPPEVNILYTLESK